MWSRVDMYMYECNMIAIVPLNKILIMLCNHFFSFGQNK